MKPKNFGLMTVRASVQGATFNMRGQLYRGQGVVPLRRAGKKMRAPLLGLAKSIYYLLLYFFEGGGGHESPFWESWDKASLRDPCNLLVRASEACCNFFCARFLKFPIISNLGCVCNSTHAWCGETKLFWLLFLYVENPGLEVIALQPMNPIKASSIWPWNNSRIYYLPVTLG